MSVFIYSKLETPIVGKSGTVYKYKVQKTHIMDVGRFGIFPDKTIDIGLLRLTTAGMMTLVKDYLWNGASGPAVDTTTFMRASAGHDALYQLFRAGELPLKFRKNADKLLRAFAREDGMGKMRAWWVYRSVRIFSKKYAEPKGGSK
jgi:hypothetical protein